MKPLYSCFLFLVLLLAFTSFEANGQFVTAFSTDNSWSAYSHNDVNNDPRPYDVVLSGAWAPAETSTTLPGQCVTSTPLTYPGTPIFAPGRVQCNFGGKGHDEITSYFKKTFTLNGEDNSICHAELTVRADNFFRLYVDGDLVQGTNQYLQYCQTINNVIGWDWHTIYTVDIAPYLDLSLSTHTIVFEVGNCSYINYLAASASIMQELTCIPNPQISYNFTSTDEGSLLTAGGLGSAGCYTHEDWRVYYTPTLGSPYSLLYSVDNSSRIGAARRIELPVGCFWYRIYHRVRYTKCDGSIVQREVLIGPFYFCSNSDGGGGGLAETPETLTENLSGDNLSGLEGNVPSNTVYTHSQLALKAGISVYPNPAQAMVTVAIPDGETAELVRLIDLQGRMVLEQRVQDQQFELDCTLLPSGVYSVQVIYRDGSQAAKKVQIQH